MQLRESGMIREESLSCTDLVNSSLWVSSALYQDGFLLFGVLILLTTGNFPRSNFNMIQDKFSPRWRTPASTMTERIRRSENSILTLMIIFRVKINVAIYIEPRNGVKIFKKWVLGMSIFTQNLTQPPLRRKQNILKYRVYCIQKNRLCNTVSTNQSVN